MKDFIRLLRESLPEIIGGLVVAAILAILASLYSQFGLWVVTSIIIGVLGLAVAGWFWMARKGRAKLAKTQVVQAYRAIPPSSQSETNGRQRILFIDDDIEIIGMSFVLPLEKQGFGVIVATNVQQALQILQSEQHLDLIVTDLMLPYGSEKHDGSRHAGLQVIEAARKLRGDIPIICLSVVRDESVEQQLIELGVDKHLRKPILPSEFIEHVKLTLLLSQSPPQWELILEEIRRRKLELRSASPYNRIRALWALGELGHYDETILGLLEGIAETDDDEDVRTAANEAAAKVRARLSAGYGAG